jgi:Zn-dependent metalloprotease
VNSNYKEKTEKKIESENVNSLYKIYEKEGYISTELINYAKANPLTIDDLEALNKTFSRESLRLLAKTLQFADQHTYDVYKQFLKDSNIDNKDVDIILHRLAKNPANCPDNLKKLAQ